MSKPDRGAMSRREFLAAGGAGLAAAGLGEKGMAAAVSVKPFALEEATIAGLGARMREGSVSAEKLAAAYLERMQEIDGGGPTLRSVIETNPDALDIAAALDRERRDGRVRGPLHGIPIVVKDNIATGDRMMTTAGSLALEGLHVREDAPLVRRLREAGAVLLGKSNLSEWANFRSSNSLSGWSSRGARRYGDQHRWRH